MKTVSVFTLLCLTGLCLAGPTAKLMVTQVNGSAYSGQQLQSSDVISVVGWTDFPVMQIQVWGMNDNGDPRLGGSALGMVSNGWLISGWEAPSRGPDYPNTNGWLYAPEYWVSLTGNDIAPFDKQGNLWGFDYAIPTLPSSSILTIECFNQTPDSGISGAWVGPGVYVPWEPLQLNINPVPEPTSFTLAGIGLLSLLRRRIQ